jgi:hypothetical protein
VSAPIPEWEVVAGRWYAADVVDTELAARDKRIAELEAENMGAMLENERLRHGMSVLCREFRESAQEDTEEGGAMAAAYSYYADRIDVLMRRP